MPRPDASLDALGCRLVTMRDLDEPRFTFRQCYEPLMLSARDRSSVEPS
jgi:hypothetical protein